MCGLSVYTDVTTGDTGEPIAAPMGSPVSPVLANIYMEMFKELTLTTAPHTPRIWKRYVDDTFCIMGTEHLEHFLNQSLQTLK